VNSSGQNILLEKLRPPARESHENELNLGFQPSALLRALGTKSLPAAATPPKIVRQELPGDGRRG